MIDSQVLSSSPFLVCILLQVFAESSQHTRVEVKSCPLIDVNKMLLSLSRNRNAFVTKSMQFQLNVGHVDATVS